MPNRHFPPRPTPRTRIVEREDNCGREEIRALDCLEVTPGQVGFPGVSLAARLRTRVLRQGQWSESIVYLLSSLTLDELQAEGMLRCKRGYWVIESRLHHCLDVTLQEDQSRVSSPNAARVLGMMRRVVVSLSNAAVDRARRCQPKTKCNTKSFLHQFNSARGGRQRLHALLFAKHPALLDLES